MKETFIKNAVIESARITIEDHGILCVWLQLNYGGMGQGFGGYCLFKVGAHKKDDYDVKKEGAYAGHFITRCLEIAGVERWDSLVGKTIRVKSDSNGLGANILAIGHIVKDDWFSPKDDFAE